MLTDRVRMVGSNKNIPKWLFNIGGVSFMSSDGTTWESATSNIGVGGISVIKYGDGQWVGAYLYDSIYTSLDGETWTYKSKAFNATLSVNGLHYANGIWVAVGDGGKIASSSDLVNWTQCTYPLETPKEINNVFFGNGLWVAVGEAQTTYADNYCFTSSDAITWTAIPLRGKGEYHEVEYHDGLWIATQNGYTISTSADGITWTKQITNLDSDAASSSLAYGNGTWALTGLNPGLGIDDAVFSSTDGGINWVLKKEFGSPVGGIDDIDSVYDIVYGDGVWVICGSVGLASGLGFVKYSTDLINWVEITRQPSILMRNRVGFRDE